MDNGKPSRVWDSKQCALLLVDYQDDVLTRVFEQDRRVVELNARTLAKVATDFKIPVILSTVGVQAGQNGPTIPSLLEALPEVRVIDRFSMNPWEDDKFSAAVKATGRKKLVIGAIVTSVCLTFAVVDALAAGYETSFIVDAVGDNYKEQHDTAVLRLTSAGGVPNTTVGITCEWFRDWRSPLAGLYLKTIVPYYDELAALKRAPAYSGPGGLTRPSAAARKA